MPPGTFERLIELLRERSIVLFSDEVYRGLEHDPADRLPAACDVYERAISLDTVSKAYGLPGSADRLARVPRSRAARSDPRAQAVHDDLLECPERSCWWRWRCATPTR